MKKDESYFKKPKGLKDTLPHHDTGITPESRIMPLHDPQPVRESLGDYKDRILLVQNSPRQSALIQAALNPSGIASQEEEPEKPEGWSLLWVFLPAILLVGLIAGFVLWMNR